MMAQDEWNPARALLLLVLWTTGSRAATSPATEPSATFDPAAILSRIMKTDSEKTAAAERQFASDITRKLWRSRVSTPQKPDDAQTQIALNDMVRKVKSVKFEAKEQAPPATGTFVMPEPADNPRDAMSARESTAEHAVQSGGAASAASEDPLSAEVSEALKHMLADPNQASEPLELAELLYLTGRINEAAIFYRKALDLTSSKEPAAREDRAWILLQLGNCLRDTDPTRAREMYGKLIAEHTDSPWVELAKAHSQLITWYEQVQPRQWLVGQQGQPARQGAASQKPQP
jgi:tetratricopeptide (TPR) repeat protein